MIDFVGYLYVIVDEHGKLKLLLYHNSINSLVLKSILEDAKYTFFNYPQVVGLGFVFVCTIFLKMYIYIFFIDSCLLPDFRLPIRFC